MSRDGDLILLEDQDRRLWNRTAIAEGLRLAESALRSAPGPYSVQAAIAAVHANAASTGQTDWPQIVALYDVLLRMQPSPVIELNRAVALAMAQGCEAGLLLLDELEERGQLRGYYLLPAARADLLRRMGQWGSAAEAYRAALALAPQDTERRFLAGRLAEVEAQAK
jgi:RNA polymerase sigma-70 factor (ECF subfamily)